MNGLKASKLLIVAALSSLYLAACSGYDFSNIDYPPVSSKENPPIASLDDVLQAPSSEVTVFSALNSRAFFSESSGKSGVTVSDTTAPQSWMSVYGGFTRFAFKPAPGDRKDFSTSNSIVSTSPDGAFRAFSQIAGGDLSLLIPGPTASGLDYTSFGVWSNATQDLSTGNLFVDSASYAFGLMTSANNVPQTGSASFTGFMAGTYVTDFPSRSSVTGDANLFADFANHTVSGSLTNIMFANSNPFPNIDLSGSYSGDRIVGTAANAASGSIPGMTGDLVARFFGPNAEEVGGAFGIAGGGAVMSGAFAAKQ